MKIGAEYEIELNAAWEQAQIAHEQKRESEAVALLVAWTVLVALGIVFFSIGWAAHAWMKH